MGWSTPDPTRSERHTRLHPGASGGQVRPGGHRPVSVSGPRRSAEELDPGSDCQHSPGRKNHRRVNMDKRAGSRDRWFFYRPVRLVSDLRVLCPYCLAREIVEAIRDSRPCRRYKPMRPGQIRHVRIRSCRMPGRPIRRSTSGEASSTSAHDGGGTPGQLPGPSSVLARRAGQVQPCEGGSGE